jgi:hypothetical protein
VIASEVRILRLMLQLAFSNECIPHLGIGLQKGRG